MNHREKEQKGWGKYASRPEGGCGAEVVPEREARMRKEGRRQGTIK